MLPPSYGQATNEQLPSYKPTLLHHDIVLLKKELSSPFDVAKDRSWDLAIVEINSTQLNLYKLKNLNNIYQYIWKLIDNENSIDHKHEIKKKVITQDTHLSSSSSSSSSFSNKSLMEFLLVNNSHTIPYEIIKHYTGAKIHSYTLQTCHIGSATDYHKKNYTLRVRIELHQFLLSFININKFNRFFNNVLIGIDLSKPLDERTLPKEKTVPNEISRFRVQNFENFYIKNCINSDHGLATYRRNTIDHTGLLNREELKFQMELAKTRGRSNSLPLSSTSSSSALISDSESYIGSPPDYKYSPEDPANEFIDENLIYSLTCMKPLEAKNDWKGSMIITGNYKSKSLSKFKSKKSSNFGDKLFVDNTSCNKFSKIVLDQGLSCKEFIVLADGLVESVI